MFRTLKERLIVISLLLITGLFSLKADEKLRTESPKFFFETGSPPWAGERIPLPPGFARDLGWTGVEEIRFAPGMFKPSESDFFSYILVFALKAGSDISEDGLERELLTYYRGLSKSVMSDSGLSVDTHAFTVTVEPAAEEHSGAPDKTPKADSWTGTLKWLEPFATRETQTLHLEIHTWKQGETPVVLSCVSPLDPKTNNSIWDSLRVIRKSFRLE